MWEPLAALVHARLNQDWQDSTQLLGVTNYLNLNLKDIQTCAVTTMSIENIAAALKSITVNPESLEVEGKNVNEQQKSQSPNNVFSSPCKASDCHQQMAQPATQPQSHMSMLLSSTPTKQPHLSIPNQSQQQTADDGGGGQKQKHHTSNNSPIINVSLPPLYVNQKQLKFPPENTHQLVMQKSHSNSSLVVPQTPPPTTALPFTNYQEGNDDSLTEVRMARKRSLPAPVPSVDYMRPYMHQPQRFMPSSTVGSPLHSHGYDNVFMDTHSKDFLISQTLQVSMVRCGIILYQYNSCNNCIVFTTVVAVSISSIETSFFLYFDTHTVGSVSQENFHSYMARTGQAYMQILRSFFI